MKNTNRYTITAALPYTNGPIHIGHMAGVFVPADIYARFLRAQKKDVLFVCGSDEHGIPITIKARKEGVTPQEIANRYHKIIGDSLKEFGISLDIYHRTSDPVHHETASAFFTKLSESDKLITQSSGQYFDEEAQQFLADRYIVGTCPNCDFDNAYGDQCESCGSTLSPAELKNPKSMLSGNTPILKETKHWFLPLDQYQQALEKWILEDHKEWKTNVYGQCKSWLTQGLQPRAITRDLDWGVQVPLPEAEGKVLYVWFDAPIGYISATKAWATANNKDWEPYWKADDTSLVHFIGKDNIVFHCIIFPAMLMAHGDFILPENVPANEFLNLEGQKISTSRNWAVWLNDYLIDFPNQQDVLRYMLTASAPETKDNDFTWKDFQARNNNELVAVYGNFINRVLSLCDKYYAGLTPACGELTEYDLEVLAELKGFPERISNQLTQYRFREGLSELMNLARLGNKYLAETEPWKLQKENPERVKTILNIGLQISASLAILSEPFLPFSSEKLSQMLNISSLGWEEAGKSDLIAANHQLNKPTLLFTKIEDDAISKQVAKLEASKNENAHIVEVTEAKPTITFDDFSKVDIRTGKILSAELVPKTKKLMKLLVDTGLDTRTIVSGIAEHYKPEEIIGQQVAVLVNLAPRSMKGIDSEGMILMAEDASGKLVFVNAATEVFPGSEIK